MLQYLSAVVLLIAFNPNPTGAICGDSPIIWRNNNITCPARAVCADKFFQVRDWYNGTRCEETRILNNCICEGNQLCPIHSAAHMLYSSTSHKQYICEPTCDVPWCGTVRRRAPAGSPSRYRSPVMALESVQRAPNFDNKNYVRMSCRCPRHHVPSPSRRSRAVRAYRYQVNYTLRQFITSYVCNPAVHPEDNQNPCPARSARPPVFRH